MNREELDPAAQILVRSYLDTRVESSHFNERYGQPFTTRWQRLRIA